MHKKPEYPKLFDSYRGRISVAGYAAMIVFMALVFWADDADLKIMFLVLEVLCIPVFLIFQQKHYKWRRKVWYQRVNADWIDRFGVEYPGIEYEE